MIRTISTAIFLLFTVMGITQHITSQTTHLIIVQPIVVQSDSGDNPASMALPEDLVDKCYQNADIDFRFLEPIFYNNTKARDGEINLDMIVQEAFENGLIKGHGDIVNMFFINKVDGIKGPLGRGMQNGNITFISLGDEETDKYLQAFVIAHEVGHNLNLHHAVDDPNVSDSLPNIMGDGAFADRIDPEYSLNDYQISEIKKSPLVHPRVDLLTKEQGEKAILDESFEAGISQMQKREIATFLSSPLPSEDLEECRSFAKKKFREAVLDFTPQEKACIRYTVDNVNRILQENDLKLMSDHPWRFIKTDEWFCGGFAHTRGTYILISQRHLDHLTAMYNEHMSDEATEDLLLGFGALLVHEQTHSLQRTFRSRFVELYTQYWNFIHAEVKNSAVITIDQVSNPDAPVAEWLIPDPTSNKWYWPRTLLKKGPEVPQMGKDFVDKVFYVEKSEEGYVITKEENGDPKFLLMDEIPFYTNSIPVTIGLDHPNEIAAYMFADYFKALVKKTAPFENINPEAARNTEAFVNWVNINMKR